MKDITAIGDAPRQSAAPYLLMLAALAAFSFAAFTLGFGGSVLFFVSGLAAILLVILALSAPVYLLYFVPVLMAIEFRVRMGPVSFTLAEASLLLVLLTVAIHRSDKRWGTCPPFQVERKWIAMLCLLALPGAFLEGDLKHALSTYRDFIIPVLFLWGFVAMRLRRNEVIRLAQVYVVLAAATAVLAIAQYQTGDFLWLQTPANAEWQEFKLGLIQASPIGAWLGTKDALPLGLYAETNDFGNFLILPICAAFAWAVTPGRTRGTRALWGIAGVILLAALILCFFRSGLLTVLAIWVFWLAFRNRRISTRALLWVGASAVALLGLVLYSGLLAFDQFGTVLGRFDMLMDALRLVWTHPLALLTGGFSSLYLLGYDQVQLVHNLELYSIIRFGLLSTLVLFALYYCILKRLKISVDDAERGDRDFRLILFAGVALMILLYGQTATLIDNIQNTMSLSFWAGVGYYHHEYTQGFDPAVSDGVQWRVTG